MTGQIQIDDMNQPDEEVGKACHELIAAGEKITFRAVAKKIGVAHTTLSRDPDRKLQVENARNLQKLAQTIRGTQRGHISESESIPLAKARLRIKELEAENAMLIASHRGMIMAVGEMGGMRAYRRFFDAHQETLKKLEDLEAIPDPVFPLRQVSVRVSDQEDI